MTRVTQSGRIAALVSAMSVSALLLLTGCSTGDGLAEQYREGSGKGYIAGDGSWSVIAEEERGAPVEFSGVDEVGRTITSADYADQVLVVNFWYAACAPCRLEAPDLQQLNETYSSQGASFLGVNVRDQAATALSFNETYDITYPSIMDANDGNVKLAFSGQVPPNAVPTTLVLDAGGRVAARILGQADPSILNSLISDTLAEAG